MTFTSIRKVDNNDNIQKVLQKKRNNATVDELVLGGRLGFKTHAFHTRKSSSSNNDVSFNSNHRNDFYRLGRLIAKNDHLTILNVFQEDLDCVALDASNRDFYDGLEQNSSINDLIIECHHQYPNPLNKVLQQILNSYQINNTTLKHLKIKANLQIGNGHTILVTTLKRCTNLRQIQLAACGINDEKLLPIVDALTGLSSLEELSLGGNKIRSFGSCWALSTLLEDTNYSMKQLNLGYNRIGNKGITVIADILANDTKLEELSLHMQDNPIDQTVENDFAKSLCDTISINSTYLSNHTLENLILYPGLSRRTRTKIIVKDEQDRKQKTSCN